MAPKRKSSSSGNRLSSKKPRAVQVDDIPSPIEPSQGSPPLARRQRQANPLFSGTDVTPQSPLPVISAANDKALPEYIRHYQKLCQKDGLPVHILQDLKRSYAFFKHQLSSEAFEQRANPALVTEWIQVCKRFRNTHGIKLLDCLTRRWEELSRIATSGYVDQKWASEVEELINTTNELCPSVPNGCSTSKWTSFIPFLLTEQERKTSIVDVDKLKRIAGLQSHNIKSGFDYVYYPFPETRAHEVAASEQIAREMKEPGILSDGARVEHVVNRPPYHARLPCDVAFRRHFHPAGVLSSLVRSVLSWGKQSPRRRPAAQARIHLTPRPDPKKPLKQLSPVRDARHRVSKIAAPPMNVPKLRGGGKKTGFGSSSSSSERAPGYRESRKPVDSDDDSSSDGGPRAPTRPDSKSPELVQVGPGYQGNYQAPRSDASASDLEPASNEAGAPIVGAQAGAESGINTALSPSGLESDADEEEHQSEQDQEATASIRTAEFTNTDGSGDETPHGEAEEEVSSSGSAEDIPHAEIKQESMSAGSAGDVPPGEVVGATAESSIRGPPQDPLSEYEDAPVSDSSPSLPSSTDPDPPTEVSGAVALNDNIGAHLGTTQRPQATHTVNELGSPIQLAPVNRPGSFVSKAYPATDWSPSSGHSALPSEAATRNALGDITDRFDHEEVHDEVVDEEEEEEEDQQDEGLSPGNKENQDPIHARPGSPLPSESDDESLSEPSVLAGQEDGPCHPCPKYRGQFHHRCDCEKLQAGSEHDEESPGGSVPSEDSVPIAPESESARAVRYMTELHRYVVRTPTDQRPAPESTPLGATEIEDLARVLILYALRRNRHLNGVMTPFEEPNSRHFRQPTPSRENGTWYSALLEWARVLADFEDPNGHTSMGSARSAAQNLAAHISRLRTYFYGDETDLYSRRTLRSYVRVLADLLPTLQGMLYIDEDEGRVIEDPEAILDTVTAGSTVNESDAEAAQSTEPARYTDDQMTHARVVRMRTLLDRLRQSFGLGLPDEQSAIRSFKSFRHPRRLALDAANTRAAYETLERAAEAAQRIAARLSPDLLTEPDDDLMQQDLQLVSGGLAIIQYRIYGFARDTPFAGAGGSEFDYGAHEVTPQLSPVTATSGFPAQPTQSTTPAGGPTSEASTGNRTTSATTNTPPTRADYTTWMFAYEMREELQHRGVQVPTGSTGAVMAQMLVDADNAANTGRGNRRSYRFQANKPNARGKPKGYQYPADL